MQDLYILTYNNYFNRIKKSENSLSEYLSGRLYQKIENVNFYKSDGVNASHVVNTEFNGDYLIVTETGSSHISSRWFIIESKYIRAGQQSLTLHRDLIIDLYDRYSNKPMFVEKGALSASDKMIFNSENMTYNQIKDSEALIKDEYGYPWIICYLEHDEEAHEITLAGTPSSAVTISASRPQCNNGPYDIIAIPTDGKIIFESNTYNINSESAFFLAQQISKALSSSGILYDIQILPYFPFGASDSASFKYDQSGLGGELTVLSSSRITLPSANTFPPLIYPTGADFKFTKSLSYPFAYSNTALNIKKDSETRFVRICAPNSSSYFDFNVAKNQTGGVSSIKLYIHCTYKPFSPFIHVYPKFGNLYKATFSPESRGLICGGDYSMPTVNDSWRSYEVNNKTYLSAFDRQIANMETNNKYQRVYDVSNALTGGVSGAVSGGIIGGAPGAVAGFGLSLAGGAVDIAIKEKLRSEALDYTKDMFGYNLQNIQALPVTLSRIGSTCIDSKYMPYLEFYTATDEEITALTNKIKYNGMTVMRIGTFSDFESRATESCQYIKGKLIRVLFNANEEREDFHIINELAGELDKGVYIE